ncbi:MAG: pyrroloquinoline quinone biosynthesis protein PqqE [Hyphomicrobiales bacterium]|nr:pyrroloquinoline quinone biosynthesis protein PqqE [Hyphomicrobiales bacterium]
MDGQTIVAPVVISPRPAPQHIARPAPVVGPPLGMLAELTHRCPLQCGYCSNPINLLKANREVDTAGWLSILEQAADLGILQIHLSGGEPTLRSDLEQFVALLARKGVYTNLITAGTVLTRDRLFALRDMGLDHLQLSIQSVRADLSDKIGNIKGGLAKKLALAGWVKESGLPLTLNAPVHRHNIMDTGAVIDLALELGADRVEIANVQYYGWAAVNKAALMPEWAQVLEQKAVVEEARERLKGILNIDFVTPDYYAKYPKPCMGGWATDVLNVTPEGKVLPCHAAESLTGINFENATQTPLADIWYKSESFNRYRGYDWMTDLCNSCDRVDNCFGGCRCQAMALTGAAENADPACIKSPHHHLMAEITGGYAGEQAPPFVYRRITAQN